MAIAVHNTQADYDHGNPFSWHAWSRLKTREIPAEQAEQVLKYGRVLKSPDARVRVVWQREIDFFRRKGVDLSACKGVHVVCALDGRVMTVYRKDDLFAESEGCGAVRARSLSRFR